MKPTAKEIKPIIVEQYADNGEHSHWHLTNPDTGEVLWSDFPEETLARGEKIIGSNPAKDLIDELIKEAISIEKENLGMKNIYDSVGLSSAYWNGRRKEAAYLLQKLKELKEKI